MEDTVVGIQLTRLQAAAESLARDGYAVVPGVLDVATCARLEAEMTHIIASIAGGAGVQLPGLKGIIMEPSELSHCGPVWEVRQAAAPYFARLHGTPHVLTSFDRVNVMPAPLRNKAPVNWLHSDQSPLLNGLHSIQGFIDLKGTSALDGGLIVASCSHRVHHELLYKEWKIDTAENWVKFDDAQRAYIDTHFRVIKVECPPGSLVLWDSRTFHQNEFPRVGGHARMVIYVSMQPLHCVPERVLEKVLTRRVAAFDERRATSHVALTHFKLFGKHMRTYGRPAPVLMVHEEDMRYPAREAIASLVGASRAPVVVWPAHPHPALLAEPLLPANVMVMTRPQLLARLGAAVAPTKRGKKRVAEGGEQSETKKMRV